MVSWSRSANTCRRAYVLPHPRRSVERGRSLAGKGRITLLDDAQAVPLLALDTEALHPKVLFELSPATKPDHERIGISPNLSGRGDRPAPDHGVVADNRKLVSEVGNRASMDRHDL